MKTSSLIIKNKTFKYSCIIACCIFSSVSVAIKDNKVLRQLSYELPSHSIRAHDLNRHSTEKLTLLSHSKLYIGVCKTPKISDNNLVYSKKSKLIHNKKENLYISQYNSSEKLVDEKNRELRKLFEKNMRKWLLEISNLDRNIFASKSKKDISNYVSAEPNWGYSFNLSSQKLKIEMAKDLQ